MSCRTMNLRSKLAQDIVNMVNSGAERDDIMIHLGMVIMLDTLEGFYMCDTNELRSKVEDEQQGRDGQIRSSHAVSSFCN